MLTRVLHAARRVSAVVALRRIKTAARPLAGAHKNAAERKPALAAQQNSTGARPFTVALKNAAERKPVLAAQPNSAGARPFTVAQKNAAERKPALAAQQNSTGARPFTVAQKNAAERKPTLAAQPNSSGARPFTVAQKNAAEREPALAAQQDIAGARPLKAVGQNKFSTIYEKSLKECIASKQVFVLAESSKIPWRFEDSDAFLDCLEKLKGFSRSSAEFHRVLNKIDAVLTRGVGVGQLYTLMKRFGRLNSQEGVELVWRHLEPRVGELGEQARVNVLWSVATSRKPPTSVPPVLAEVDHAALDPLHLYRLLMGCSRMNIKIPWKRVSPAIVAMLKNPECKTFYLPRIFTSIVQTAPADLTDAVMRAIRQQLEDLEYRDLEEIFQAMARHYQHPDMLHEVEERMLIFQKRGAAPSGSTA